MGPNSVANYFLSLNNPKSNSTSDELRRFSRRWIERGSPKYRIRPHKQQVPGRLASSRKACGRKKFEQNSGRAA